MIEPRGLSSSSITTRWGAPAILLLMAGCASQPKIVNQFGDAATTAVKAENAYYDALDQRMALRFEVCMLAHKEVDISDIGVLNALSKNKDDMGCIDPKFPPDSKLVPADVRKALNAVFDAIEKYGASLQALIGDNPTADFDKNVDALGKNLQGFDKNVLTKLQVKGPTDAELNAAGQAVKFIGDVLIKYAVDKDVKEAATKAQQPLQDIVTVIEKVNGYWQPIAANLAREDGSRIIELWRHETVTGRKALYDEWSKTRAPLTTDKVDDALQKLLDANRQLGLAGAAGSTAAIKAAVKAANDAYDAYKQSAAQ